MPPQKRRRKKAHSAGRPLKGDRKRERVSFTLHPLSVRWLRQTARARGKSRSELLDDIFVVVQDIWEQETKRTPSRRCRIPLPQEKLNNFCRRYHVQKLSLFGSVLTEDFDKNSDVDVLVEFDAAHVPSLFAMSTMESQLSEIFGGRKVDLRTRGELSRYFRDTVLQEAEPVYVS